MTEIMERNEIIPIRVNDDGTIKISGRDLHEFLEVKSKYIDWINRMLEYGFTENIDYMQINELSQKKEGSRNVTREIIDHVITKGRLFLYDLLKDNNILPIIEK